MIVKHQLTLRRLLLYVALFAIGLGMFRAAYELLFPFRMFAEILGLYCVVAGVFCPIGYLISEKDGEILGAVFAVYATLILIAIVIG